MVPPAISSSTTAVRLSANVNTPSGPGTSSSAVPSSTTAKRGLISVTSLASGDGIPRHHVAPAPPGHRRQAQRG